MANARKAEAKTLKANTGRRHGGKPWTKYPKTAILEAIKVCDGFKSRVYRALGMDSGTLDRYLARFPDLAKAFDEAKTEVDELAEIQLVANVRAGDQRAIEFYLERRLPDKYGRRPEVQVGLSAKDGELKAWLSAAEASWTGGRGDDG
ncbi:MAG: hypothetical protein II943_00475 [Victivallales bacterium]|nr:hypothetical protein [Victivallales bacterium]